MGLVTINDGKGRQHGLDIAFWRLFRISVTTRGFVKFESEESISMVDKED